jgi:hypothetical protein
VCVYTNSTGQSIYNSLMDKSLYISVEMVLITKYNSVRKQQLEQCLHWHINLRRARPDDGRLVAETCRHNNMYVDLALKLIGAQ